MDDNALDLLEAAKDTLFAIFKGDPYATNNAAVMRNRIDVFLQHRQIDRLAASPPHNDGQEDVVLDKARLDSGLIRIEDRDEFGEPIGRLFVGLNLREAIDKGREEAT